MGINFFNSEAKMQFLNRLKQTKDLTTLDLRNAGLTGRDVPEICEIIKGHPDLKEVYLSNNDLRDDMLGIFNALRSCRHLQILDIVDNNMEGEDIWENLAALIKADKELTQIYVGAKRIMGSSNGRHTVFDRDLQKDAERSGEKLYHNTWWTSGYYGTGFNELVRGDVMALAGALQARISAGYPVSTFYLVSKARTETQIEKQNDRYTYNRENAVPKIARVFMQYNTDFYALDDQSYEISQLLKPYSPVSSCLPQ